MMALVLQANMFGDTGTSSRTPAVRSNLIAQLFVIKMIVNDSVYIVVVMRHY